MTVLKKMLMVMAVGAALSTTVFACTCHFGKGSCTGNTCILTDSGCICG
jgi:hypothetical protein